MPMDPLIGAAAFSAGAGLVSGLLGNKASREAEDRAYQRSIELQRMQNDFNVQMWNRSNAYNSPLNQVKLYKDAGINPALYSLGGGNSAASEVTASDASVPMNGDQGKIIQGIGDSVGQGASRVIQALQADAQIKKLRNDIEFQELQNRDLRNRIEADETDFESQYGDEEGKDWVYFVNHYHERATHEAEMHGLDRRSARARQKLSEGELEVFDAVKDIKKDLTRQELASLLQDIKSKSLNNTILEGEAELMRKYGISPHDQGWTSLVKIALRDPHAFDSIISALGSAVSVSGSSLLNKGLDLLNGRSSHSNPRNGSSSW